MAKNKDDADDAGGEGGKKGGKLKLIAIIVPVVLLLVGGGLYFFVFSAGSEADAAASAAEDGAEPVECAEDEECEEGAASEATPTSTYVPGAVVEVEPVTINLAGGHYLKVGLALQATADAGEEVPPGKAADALISLYSGRTVDELATEEGREATKKELLKLIKKSYEKKVYEVYFTTFVMN